MAWLAGTYNDCTIRLELKRKSESEQKQPRVQEGNTSDINFTSVQISVCLNTKGSLFAA